MTWAVSWLALLDTRREYQEARKLLASYHDRYGDEITFIPGGYFAPMYNTREAIRVTIHQALGKVSGMVGGGYRPRTRASTYARGRSGASTGSITGMGMAGFAIRTIPAGSII
jgi:hypothetical protein